MTVVTCSLPSKWLDAMLPSAVERPSTKKYELRPATEKWLAVKSGDILQVTCEQFTILCVSGYPDYLNAIREVMVQLVFPGIESDQEGVKICEELYGHLLPGTNVVAINIEYLRRVKVESPDVDSDSSKEVETMGKTRIFFDNIYRDSVLQLNTWPDSHKGRTSRDTIELAIIDDEEFRSKRWLIAYDLGSDNPTVDGVPVDPLYTLTDEDPVAFIKNKFLHTRDSCKTADCTRVHRDEDTEHENMITSYCPRIVNDCEYKALIIVDSSDEYPADRGDLPNKNYDDYIVYFLGTHLP